MKIDVHHHFDPFLTQTETRGLLDTINTKLDTLLKGESTLTITQQQLADKLNADAAALQAVVARQTTIVAGEEALANGITASMASLKDQLAAALKAAVPGIDETQLQPAFDIIDAQTTALGTLTDGLAANLTANTPPTTVTPS